MLEEEVKDIKGMAISPRESQAYNPAFDVTPNRYVTVRGAPSIGAAAAYGVAQARALGKDIEEAGKLIKSARPTAYDLFFCSRFCSATQGGS